MKLYRIRAAVAAIALAAVFLFGTGLGGPAEVSADASVSEFVFFTVTFLTEDGDPILTEKVQKGQMANGPEEDPVTEGAEFAGWETGDGESFDPKTDEVTEDLVLYAVFESDTEDAAELELGEPGVVVLSDEDTPLADGASGEDAEEDDAMIEDDDVPLAAVEDRCYVHWLILLLTFAAGGYNVVREFERLGQDDEQNASQEV